MPLAIRQVLLIIDDFNLICLIIIYKLYIKGVSLYFNFSLSIIYIKGYRSLFPNNIKRF